MGVDRQKPVARPKRRGLSKLGWNGWGYSLGLFLEGPSESVLMLLLRSSSIEGIETKFPEAASAL